MYDVADLLTIVPHFKGPRISLEQTGGAGESGGDIFEDAGGDSREGGETRAEMRRTARQNLIGIIQEAIGEEMWQPQGTGSIRLLGGKLLISQTQLGFKLLEMAIRS